MRKLFLFTALAALPVCSQGAAALEGARYESLTKETIQELVAGKIASPDATLARLKQAMEIGIAGCKEYIAKHPEDAALISKVIADAPGMTKMSAEALEEAWGDDGMAGDSVGRPLKSVDNNGVTRGFLDIVVHPARAYDLVVEFGKSHDVHALEEAKGELVESLEHLKRASTAL